MKTYKKHANKKFVIAKYFVPYYKKSVRQYKKVRKFYYKIKLIKNLTNQQLHKKKVESALILKSKFIKKINIKFVQNNLFCTLVDVKKNKILHTSSSGKYGIEISKRQMKKNYIEFLELFFKKIEKYCKNLNHTMFNISAPIKIRKKVWKIVKRQIFVFNAKKVLINRKFRLKFKKRYNILINLLPLKCFNGCRVKKKLKKKRRLYRLYK